ncbi:MAG: peptidoglycan editing factor PgeF [Gammaproteobacteria bacterium]
MTNFIVPNWPAPKTIKAFTTLRTGGVSLAPYDSFNLGEHVGDETQHVKTNRENLKTQLNLQNQPVWLNQTHSTRVIPATTENTGKEADAAFTDQPGNVCAVLTADCLPLLVCQREGTHVAAIHAGWRGLANGVIENTLTAMGIPADDTLVWLGPAIGPKVFEVGDEVREIFLKSHPEAEQMFLPSPNGRWLGNLYALARLRLNSQGITHIYGGDYCTYSDSELFFSYRRDGNKTGRMASLIWM